jgi:hypothetical protein
VIDLADHPWFGPWTDPTTGERGDEDLRHVACTTTVRNRLDVAMVAVADLLKATRS